MAIFDFGFWLRIRFHLFCNSFCLWHFDSQIRDQLTVSELCFTWSVRLPKKPCGSRACVWTIWIDVKLLFSFSSLQRQRGSESHSIHCPTKTVVWGCDIWTDHPDVPAIFHFVVNGNRLSQKPACRFSNNLLSISQFARFSQSVRAVNFASSLGYGNSFWLFLESVHQLIPVRYNWSVFARKMHSTSEFAKIVLSKCVFVSVCLCLCLCLCTGAGLAMAVECCAMSRRQRDAKKKKRQRNDIDMSKDLFLPASAFNIQRERDEKFKRSRKKEMLSDKDVVRKRCQEKI